ncbi:MAG: TIGR04283 family arsenosugar biosynthesis glycosyltransferase [Deltaproteobacteria bacterium]|nr:TIGR04283 family arsenosugar biosynthesis glycosyltransferase [Deltaproteobacteria bacterium]
MRIAVVIPARDEADGICAAVQSARAAGVEVLVVDGGSVDATAARARAAGARVLRAPPGRARQMQAGAKAAGAGADAILFLHADTRLPAGYADALRQALANPRIAGGAFALRFAERRLALRWVEWGLRLRLWLLRLPYGDQAVFVRRSALMQLGGVPQAPIMEDLDLVRGIQRLGGFALLRSAVTTSARRYLERGVARTVWRNTLALAGWSLGLPRARLAAWYRGRRQGNPNRCRG